MGENGAEKTFEGVRGAFIQGAYEKNDSIYFEAVKGKGSLVYVLIVLK